MEFLKTIAMRKTTREFKSDLIPEDIIDIILSVGCAAPVGSALSDSLQLTVIQNPYMLKKISATASKFLNTVDDMLYGCTALIIISCKPTPKAPGAEYAQASCIAENMLLAATHCGIGNVYLFGVTVAVKSDSALKAELKIAEDFHPMCAVALGYPANPDNTQRELRISIPIDRF